MPPGYAGLQPDALPLSVSRTPTFAWAARADLPADAPWDKAEALCPVGVPLRDIAKFVLDQANLTVPASSADGSDRH